MAHPPHPNRDKGFEMARAGRSTAEIAEACGVSLNSAGLWRKAALGGVVPKRQPAPKQPRPSTPPKTTEVELPTVDGPSPREILAKGSEFFDDQKRDLRPMFEALIMKIDSLEQSVRVLASWVNAL